jgi:hypothetical protein
VEALQRFRQIRKICRELNISALHADYIEADSPDLGVGLILRSIADWLEFRVI